MGIVKRTSLLSDNVGDVSDIALCSSVGASAFFKGNSLHHTITHAEGSSIVKAVDLTVSALVRLNNSDSRVLLVEPRALHIRLLLGIVGLIENLTSHVGKNANFLVFHRSNVTTCELGVEILVSQRVLLGTHGCSLSVEIAILSCEVPAVESGIMLRNDSAEASLLRVDRSVNKR